MTYLLDTDTLVFMVRGLKIRAASNERQRQREVMARHIFDTGRGKTLAGHEVALSAITVAEMEFVAQNSGNYQEEIEVVRRSCSPQPERVDRFSCVAYDRSVKRNAE